MHINGTDASELCTCRQGFFTIHWCIIVLYNKPLLITSSAMSGFPSFALHASLCLEKSIPREEYTYEYWKLYKY